MVPMSGRRFISYCTNCGAQYDDGAKFCPTCGATTGETAQSNAQQNAAYTTPTQPAQQPVQTDNSKTMAILAVVFPILFFLPIVTNPKTEFGTFWANQALLLLLLSVVASITAGIVIGILIWIFQVVLCGSLFITTPQSNLRFASSP